MSDSFFRRQCVSTCPDPAPCACAANEECIQISRYVYTQLKAVFVIPNISSLEIAKIALRINALHNPPPQAQESVKAL